MFTLLNARIIYRSLILCTPTQTPFNTIHISLRHCQHNERLALVGRLQTPKLDGEYDTGQLFVSLYGYRGVTLFTSLLKSENYFGIPEYTLARTRYIALIDERDIDIESTKYKKIPGLIIVRHEAMLPYTSTEKLPIHHEKFDYFLMYDPERDPPYIARETLKEFQERNMRL